MTVLQISALAAVTVSGTAVVIAADPLKQTLLLGMFGMSLAMLFFVFQAPDVALSEIVVSSVGLPVMVLLAIRKVRQQEEEQRQEESGE